jgi:hypothetical protein
VDWRSFSGEGEREEETTLGGGVADLVWTAMVSVVVVGCAVLVLEKGRNEEVS